MNWVEGRTKHKRPIQIKIFFEWSLFITITTIVVHFKEKPAGKKSSDMITKLSRGCYEYGGVF